MYRGYCISGIYFLASSTQCSAAAAAAGLSIIFEESAVGAYLFSVSKSISAPHTHVIAAYPNSRRSIIMTPCLQKQKWLRMLVANTYAVCRRVYGEYIAMSNANAIVISFETTAVTQLNSLLSFSTQQIIKLMLHSHFHKSSQQAICLGENFWHIQQKKTWSATTFMMYSTALNIHT